MALLQETFQLLYWSADSPPEGTSRWNASAYTHRDVIASAHLFAGSADDAPINDVTRGFPVDHASASAATFAFRDQVSYHIIQVARVLVAEGQLHKPI